MRRMLASLLAAGLLAAPALAQGARHELGLRLRAFERRLAAVPSAELRAAAYRELERAVQSFFRLDLGSAGRSIDAATQALEAPPKDERELQALQRARSLQLELDRRLVDAAQAELNLELSSFYEVADGADPTGWQLAVRLHQAGEWQRDRIDELPLRVTRDLRDLPPGDHTLEWRIEREGRPLVTRHETFSVARDLDARLQAVLDAAAAARRASPATIESATLTAHGNLLRTTQRRTAYEAELPAAALLDEAEKLATLAEQVDAEPFYTGARSGSLRLRVPVGRAEVAVRLFAPEVEQGERPIVVALHGAGGSENFFFDTHGDGACVDLAKARGWFVVAPRVSLRGVDCAALVDALAERYPIDRSCIFVVGHSMGAAQAMSNVSRQPDRFRAVAPLAGGGNVRRSDELAKVPFFVGVGERDFALAGARQLAARIKQAGASCVLREYPTVEHLTIVQIALPDVFAFFADHAKR